MTRRTVLWVCLLATLLGGSAVANAPNVVFKFAKVVVPGSTQAFAAGISNSGSIVGSYEDSANVYRGFILIGKNLTTLNPPNATSSSANNLARNGALRVVGEYTNKPTNRGVGFLYQGGRYEDISGPSGSLSSSANDINGSGEIVGSYSDSTGLTYGYLLTKHGYTTFKVSMAQLVVATGINDNGMLVYWAVNGLTGVTTSYLYNIKTRQSTTIDVPGASNSLAQSINNEGDVSYQWSDSAGNSHGALYHQGKYYKFDYPRSASNYAAGLNDRNMLVGAYEAASNGPFSAYQANYK